MDYEATAQLLRRPRGLTKFQQGLLRTFLSGAVSAQDRVGAVAEHRRKRETERCEPCGTISRQRPLCHSGVEDTAHIMESCAHPDMVSAREEHAL